MLHNTFCRRLAALVLTLAVAVSAVLPVFAVYPMPIQTATETEAVYLFNADTGKTLLTQNADQPRYVASLTKLMTALLLLESGKDLNGEVTVPTDLTQEFKDIQNANGTTMGLRIGETVRRIDLLNALLITSANDAARAGLHQCHLYLRPRPVRLRQCGLGRGHGKDRGGLRGQRDLCAGGRFHYLYAGPDEFPQRAAHHQQLQPADGRLRCLL